MEQQTKNCPLYGKKENWRRMAKATVALLLACAPSIYVSADNQDIQIRYDKNSYLKNLVITPEIDADLKANKEMLLYVVKRKERNYHKIFTDSVAAVTAKIEAIENDMRNIERLKGLQGKKYSSDTDREFVGRQITLHAVPAEKIADARNAYNQARGTNTFSGISNMLKAAKQETSLNNLQKDAQKELNKNKIGEKTVSVLSDRLVALESDKAAYNRTKEVLENWQQQGLSNLKSLIWFDPDTIDEYSVCSDTIVNPYHPTLVKKRIKSRFTQDPKSFARLVNLTYDKEWEWVLTEARASMHEDFPRKMDYYRYESHPDLRIMDYNSQRNVYDKNGNIVAVVNPDLGLTVDADVTSQDGIGKLVARFAYENNDHDIQSYDAKTLHYVKTRVGLEEYTAKEKAEQKALTDKLANASANYILDNMKYGSNTKKGRQAQEKNAVDFLGAMLSAGSSSYYSSTGHNWFEQIKRDYTDNVYAIVRERIDGVTFRSVYADNNANPLFEITVRYEADKNYYLKQTIVEFKKCPKTDQVEQAMVQKIYEMGIVDLPFTKGEVSNIAGRREVKNAEYVFDVVDKMPSFPGGEDAMMSWISSNIKYPVIAEENGVQGCVICSVVVEPNGSITDVQVINGVDPSLDKEAIRVIKRMPTWNPGKLNGSAVRVKYTIPVTFRL